MYENSDIIIKHTFINIRIINTFKYNLIIPLFYKIRVGPDNPILIFSLLAKQKYTLII